MTALMSISHRITGVILAGGCLVVTLILLGAAMGKDYYDCVMDFAATPVGTGLLFAWSFVMYYHLCNGVRHLIWDTVHLLGERTAVLAGWVVLAATLALTAVTWHCAGYSL
jgi:succinate dehydrogenase / fumarate reductase cytochrome b subunit